MTAQLKLAEIISARLCHDLAGPIGTLSATLEMVADGGAEAVEALQIAHDAAHAMRSRLRFIRAAWAVDGAERDAASIRDYCGGLPQARKVSFQLSELAGLFDARMSRTLLNLAMLGIESLPKGGTITLTGGQETGVVMSIKGPGAGWPNGFASLLTDDADVWSALRDSRTLQAPLTALISRQNGLKIRLLMSSHDTAAPLPLLLDLA